jgi:hypothetical protein
LRIKEQETRLILHEHDDDDDDDDDDDGGGGDDEIYKKHIHKQCLVAKQHLLQAIVLLLRLFTEA